MKLYNHKITRDYHEIKEKTPSHFNKIREKFLLNLVFFCVICGSLCGLASAGDVFYETDIITFPLPVNNIGGFPTITPHYHYWDNYFSLYNDGRVTYMIYVYNYTGVKTVNITGEGIKSYTNSFIGTVEPDQCIMLQNNASYYIYADYQDIRELESVEMVKERFNQWWMILLMVLILLIGLYAGYRMVTKR